MAAAVEESRRQLEGLRGEAEEARGRRVAIDDEVVAIRAAAEANAARHLEETARTATALAEKRRPKAGR